MIRQQRSTKTQKIKDRFCAFCAFLWLKVRHKSHLNCHYQRRRKVHSKPINICVKLMATKLNLLTYAGARDYLLRPRYALSSSTGLAGPCTFRSFQPSATRFLKAFLVPPMANNFLNPRFGVRRIGLDKLDNLNQINSTT